MKKKKVILFIVIILLIVITVAWWVNLNLDYLERVIENSVQKYGLFGILFFAGLADMLVQPMGPEVPALIGILFNLNIIGILTFTLIGSVIGSLLSFYIGKKYFSGRVRSISKLDKKKSAKVLKVFRKYGKWGLALAAITPVPWVAFCWIVGSFKMKKRRFIFYGLIPRGIRIIVVVLGAWGIWG